MIHSSMAQTIHLALLFLLLSFSTFAQNAIRFTNSITGEEVIIKEGDMAKFSYSGYLNQPEVVENRIFRISPIDVHLAQMAFGQVVPQTQRTVLLNDINGFRKFFKYRTQLKTSLQLASTVGVILLYPEIVDRDKLSRTEDILISLGVSIGVSLIIEALFPKKIKHRMNQGWQYEYVPVR